MPVRQYEDIAIGESFTLERQITDELVGKFADLSGDFNPVHMDDEFCLKHGLNSRLAHGALVLSFLSALIGMHLPGEGSVWLSQKIDFIAPVMIGDRIAITATVTGKDHENALSLKIIQMKIVVKKQNGATAARGTVRVSLK